MNRAAFFEAAGELSIWVESLWRKTEASLRQAEDELCRKRALVPGEPPSEPSVAYELAAIRERIEEVMYAFDLLVQAAGRRPRFELALRLLEAHRIVQWEVEQRLAGLPWRHPRPSSTDLTG